MRFDLTFKNVRHRGMVYQNRFMEVKTMLIKAVSSFYLWERKNGFENKRRG